MSNPVKDAFDGVRASEALKQRTSARLAARLHATPKRRACRFKRLAVTCACLVVVLAGFAGWRLYDAPVCAISVDINPSVELGVNRFGRVVKVEGRNPDGEAVAKSAKLTNLPYDEALGVLLDSEPIRSYVSNDGLVWITVIGRTDEESEIMRLRIASCGYAARANVSCQCGRRGDVAAAREVGLSFGKYRAFLALQTLDPSITAEDVRGLTMRQIRNLLLEASQGTGSGANGNGCGNRNQKPKHDER